MSGEPQLFKIDRDTRKSEAMKEINFAQLGLKERQDIQEWVADNPDILGDNLLIIAKEFSGFDNTNERLDLLAVDTDGKLVVIELKRDDSGADVHWQAIKYASYLHRASNEAVIDILAEYGECSVADAEAKLKEHLRVDDLNGLNNDQRIILTSHRFAPEVTSAVLWLNEKLPGENPITCIQLTPYQDGENGPLYVQANTIIPVPGDEGYRIGVGTIRRNSAGQTGMKSTGPYWDHQNDDITRFCKGVHDLLKNLPDNINPNMSSWWAGDGGGPRSGRRQYHLWYNKEGWRNWRMTYLINVYDKVEGQPWRAEVGFGCQCDVNDLKDRLEGVDVPRESEIVGAKPGLLSHIVVTHRSDVLDDSFAETLGSTLRQFIEVITPKIDEELNAQSADESRE